MCLYMYVCGSISPFYFLVRVIDNYALLLASVKPNSATYPLIQCYEFVVIVFLHGDCILNY